MKNVVKVAISKVAFSFEEEAYGHLKAYLDSLEAHFASKPSGKEIMEEIESRIAELLTEKCGSDSAVTLKIAQEVTETLGSIEDMDPERDSGQPASDAKGESKPKRKLYRDLQNKRIGGVCSGLAAYFGKDSTLFRLVAALVFVLFLVAEAETCWIPVALYVLLWIVMPGAKTVEERHRMRGESNTIDEIMNNVAKNAAEMGGEVKDFARRNSDVVNTLGRIVEIVMGVILLIIGIGGLVCLIGVSIGFTAALPLAPSALLNIFMVGNHGVLVSILLYLLVCLPLIAILYGGVLLTFKLKSPRWRPGLMMFILWVVSLLVFAALSWKTVVNYNNSEVFEWTEKFETDGGVLKIELSDADMEYDYITLDADRDSYRLMLIKDGNIYHYPEIYLRRNDADGQLDVRGKTVSFNHKAIETDFYSYSDGVLTVKPNLFTKGGISGFNSKVRLTLPEGMEVYVDAPRSHDFKRRQHHSNIAILR